MYFFYDGVHYISISENDLLHHVVSTISQERNPLLMNWKHKTKLSILKRIKDHSIYKTIPETNTIQMILQYICPMLVTTRTEAKYLLTILGDNLLKKNTNHIHFIHPSVKPFFKTINQMALEKFHSSCIQTFKYKYHEKHLDEGLNCRLVATRTNLEGDWLYSQTLSQHALDILCVACHYSNKHHSADEYVLDRSQDMDLKQYVFRLQNSSPELLLQQFSKEYLKNTQVGDEDFQISSSPQEDYLLQNIKNWEDVIIETTLTWKQIQYLWKDFLTIHHLPANLYNNVCKTILTERIFPLQYDMFTDSFTNVASSQIPLIQKFLKFWSETIVDDVNEYAVLECEEIALLFRSWLSHQKHKISRKSKYWLKESKILDILNYFHSELHVEENKYIYHVRSKLWDKEMDIEIALSSYREHLKGSDTSNVVSIYDAYLFYCKFQNHGQRTSQEQDKYPPLLVSKTYFEKYIVFQYGNDFTVDFLEFR